jgi:hypothetical protein
LSDQPWVQYLKLSQTMRLLDKSWDSSLVSSIHLAGDFQA